MHWQRSEVRQEAAVNREAIDNRQGVIGRQTPPVVPQRPSGIRSLMYNVSEEVILDLPRKDVICKTLNAHIAKPLDTDVAADMLPKKLVTSSSFMPPIATFGRRKTDSIIAY